MKGETKDQRFKRIVQKRVQNVLDSLRSCLIAQISGCMNGMKNSSTKYGQLSIKKWSVVRQALKMLNQMNSNYNPK